MALDGGMLAMIDRRIFDEFGTAAATQMVKVPLSDAAWSTWRRYCRVIGLTMGEALAGLIDHELRMVVDEPTDADGPLFGARREEELAARELRLAVRERDVVEIEKRNREWANRLGAWERELQTLERNLRDQRSRVAPGPCVSLGPTGVAEKRGRNEPCHCGSGLKYKRCHGRRS
ncbi:MAG: SEC-C metal-binding domain-containing protein [Acidimicrobiia bacterium]